MTDDAVTREAFNSGYVFGICLGLLLGPFFWRGIAIVVELFSGEK